MDDESFSDDFADDSSDDNTEESPGYRPDRRQLLQAGGAGLLGLMALGGAQSARASELVASATPRRGGTLTIALTGGAGDTLIPGRATSLPDQVHQYSLFDRLYEAGFNGQAVPGLAESATPSFKGARWRIRIRKGVRFHNGKPMTADDVLWTIRSWSDPNHRMSGVVKPIIKYSALRKVDNWTIDVPLWRRVAEFPSFLANYQGGIIPNGANFLDPRPVGSGPFVLESFTPGKLGIFTANGNYWESGKPYISRLITDGSYVSDAARMNAVLSGAADMVPLADLALASQQRGRNNIKLLNVSGSGMIAFTMRTDKAPFNDVRVRQAMRYIVDRKQMINVALYGFGSIGNDIPVSTAKYFASDFKREQDIERAKSLLRAAGSQDLKVEITTSARSGYASSAVLFQQQAKEAGVDVSIRNVPTGVYFTAASGWPGYPFGQTTHLGPGLLSLSIYYLRQLWTGATAGSETAWGNPAADKLLFDAIAETNEAKAKEKWHEVQRLQFNQGGFIKWNNLNFVDAMTHRVQGVRPSKSNPAGLNQAKNVWLT